MVMLGDPIIEPDKKTGKLIQSVIPLRKFYLGQICRRSLKKNRQEKLNTSEQSVSSVQNRNIYFSNINES